MPTKSKKALFGRTILWFCIIYIFLLFFTALVGLFTRVDGQHCYDVNIHYDFLVDITGCKK